MATSTIKEIGTPVEYTGYSFNAYKQQDAGQSGVFIIGKLCVFSLTMTYSANYTPSDTQVFITGMPKAKKVMMMQGITYSDASDSSRFRPFRYKITTNGEIQNWYSGLKTIANNPTVFSGVYVIA